MNIEVYIEVYIDWISSIPWKIVIDIAVPVGSTVLAVWSWLLKKIKIKHGGIRLLSVAPLLQPQMSGLGYYLDSIEITPITIFDNGNRVVNFLRQLYINWVCCNTSPKPVFEVINWRYIPVDTINAEGLYNNSRGSILAIELGPGESSKHFISSLQPKKATNTRIIVIASSNDMSNNHSWVRCIRVNAFDVKSKDGKPKHIALSSEPGDDWTLPWVFFKKAKDVPKDALWLVYAAQEPSGLAFDEYGFPIEYTTGSVYSCRDNSIDEYIKVRTKSIVLDRIAKWLFLLILFPLLFVGLILLAFWTNSESEDAFIISFGSWVLLCWIIIVVVPGLLTGLYMLFVKVQTWCWLKNDGMKKTEWSGGTLKCLAAGKMLGRVCVVDEKVWNSIWESIDFKN